MLAGKILANQRILAKSLLELASKAALYCNHDSVVEDVYLEHACELREIATETNKGGLDD